MYVHLYCSDAQDLDIIVTKVFYTFYSVTLTLPCTTWWWPPQRPKHVVASYLLHIANKYSCVCLHDTTLYLSLQPRGHFVCPYPAVRNRRSWLRISCGLQIIDSLSCLCLRFLAQVEALQRDDPWSKECHQLSTNTIHTRRGQTTLGLQHPILRQKH